MLNHVVAFFCIFKIAHYALKLQTLKHLFNVHVYDPNDPSSGSGPNTFSSVSPFEQAQ